MQKEFTWLARDAGLRLFGENFQEALEAYHSFVLAGIDLEGDINFKKGILAGIIGDDLFIESVRKKYRSKSVIEDNPFKINLKILLAVVVPAPREIW